MAQTIHVVELIVILCAGVIYGSDVGCSSYFDQNLQAYGKCVRNGCCAFSAQITDGALCDQSPSETCCFRDNTCSDDFCFDVYGTWVSQYNYATSPAEIDQAFAVLKSKSIKRVQFNVWANGVLYANSATAASADVLIGEDRLQWAIQSARQHGLEIYAWLEYGSMACYGSSPSNQFARTADSSNWLLYNTRSGQKVYNTDDTGNFVYMDITKQAVRDFLVGMTKDLVSSYDLDGIQYDDHFGLPGGFDTVDGLTQTNRYSQTESLMLRTREAVKAIKPSIHVSYSPSPLQFSRDKHNIDWANWVSKGVVEEVIPQYYRSTAGDFQTVLDQDLAVVTRKDELVAGIRLSGSCCPELTPQAEVDRMIQISYNKGLKGVSFWLVDNIVTGSYNVPFLRIC